MFLVIQVLADPPTRSRGGRSVVVVDNRKDTRDFLVSRRARITPEKARLPAYGRNRRVPGLRREEVALLAGVSVDYYTRLERGNLNGVSESVLEALAANRLGQALYAPLIDSPARPANSARFVFLDPRATDFFVDWERAADDIVAILRAVYRWVQRTAGEP